MILKAVNIIPNAQYIKEHNYDMFEKTGAKYKLSAARMGTECATSFLAIYRMNLAYNTETLNALHPY